MRWEIDRLRRAFLHTGQTWILLKGAGYIAAGLPPGRGRRVADIDMAKGALIAIHGCDPDGAFARLTDESQRRNTKLRDVAREILERLQTPAQ